MDGGFTFYFAIGQAGNHDNKNIRQSGMAVKGDDRRSWVGALLFHHAIGQAGNYGDKHIRQSGMADKCVRGGGLYFITRSDRRRIMATKISAKARWAFMVTTTVVCESFTRLDRRGTMTTKHVD